MSIVNNFSIYIPSKNRSEKCLTANILLKEKIPFFLVIEPQIGICGLKHIAWAFKEKAEISINQQVYSCVFVNNKIDIWWRNDVVEDCDYSLQILTKGFCTVIFNTFLIDKVKTMSMKGGNTEIEYLNGGRSRRALGMQKTWPGIFTIKENNGIISLKPSRIWRTFATQLNES